MEPFYVGNSLGSAVFQIEYLDVKGRVCGVVQQMWYCSDNLDRAAKPVAQFTNKTLGTKK
jgi:hypothetical protein